VKVPLSASTLSRVFIGALAGYCRRKGDRKPAWHLARKFFYRIRQWCYGAISGKRTWRAEARLHLGALRAGYREGRTEPE